MWLVRLMCVVAVACFTANCATVVRGTTEDVAFESQPQGALAMTSLGQSCTTPCILKINRSDAFVTTFKLDGYKDATVVVRTQTSGGGAAGLAGNVIAGGIIGVGVDAVSGAYLDHIPNPVVGVLERVAPVQPAPRARRRSGVPVSAVDPVITYAQVPLRG